MRRVLLLLTAVVALTGAEPRLGRLFSDHMVLQRDSVIPVWGWADAGTAVTGTLADVSATTTTTADGRFELRFPALPAGGPHDLVITCGSVTLMRRDILIGEVWVAGGQSNMLFELQKSTDGAAAIAAADLPRVRLFHALFHSAPAPARDVYARQDRFVNGAWKVATPDSVPFFSAVAFHFAKGLHQHLDVPVGIIQCCWHSTPIEPWMPPDVLAVTAPDLLDLWAAQEQAFDPAADRDAIHRRRIAQWEHDRDTAVAANRPVPPWPNKPPDAATLERDYPGRLFNGMIHPLIPYGMRGMIWYQGESSAWGAWRYRSLFPAAIAGWRQHWGHDFPLLFVEISGWHPTRKGPAEAVETKEVYPVLREAQQFTASTVPNTALISSIDLFDRANPNDIHPPQKQEVGRRLVLAARRLVHGETEVVAAGPRFAAMKVVGATARITFAEIGSGLTSSDGAPLRGFALAGTDRRWHAASATIDGDTVLLRVPTVPDPVAAAYNWAAIPDGNLSNREGFPASGFRSDDWPRATQP